MPAGAQFRSNDPRFPLTGAGALPLREAPATRENRLALGLAALLVAWVLAGVLVALWSGAQEPRSLSAYLPLDWLEYCSRWMGRWWRLACADTGVALGPPAGSVAARAKGDFACSGWACGDLLGAVDDDIRGLPLGAIGLALLLIVCVLAAPITRRISWRQAPPSAWSIGPSGRRPLLGMTSDTIGSVEDQRWRVQRH